MIHPTVNLTASSPNGQSYHLPAANNDSLYLHRIFHPGCSQSPAQTAVTSEKCHMAAQHSHLWVGMWAAYWGRKLKKKPTQTTAFSKGNMKSSINSQCRNIAELFWVGNMKVTVRQSVEVFSGFLNKHKSQGPSRWPSLIFKSNILHVEFSLGQGYHMMDNLYIFADVACREVKPGQGA